MTDVGVNSKGKCVWSGPATFKVNCEMKINDWPFDEQDCDLAFGSYTYGKNLLKIKLFKDRGGNFASKESSIVYFCHLKRLVDCLVHLFTFFIPHCHEMSLYAL